jgi:hypothetical protein
MTQTVAMSWFLLRLTGSSVDLVSVTPAAEAGPG